MNLHLNLVIVFLKVRRSMPIWTLHLQGPGATAQMRASLSWLFLEGVESRAQPHQGGFLPSPRGHLQQGSRSDLSTGKARTDCGHSSGRALSLELRTCHLSSSCGSQMCLGHLHVASCSQTCHFSHIPASLLVPTPERAALMVMLARTHRVILC